MRFFNSLLNVFSGAFKGGLTLVLSLVATPLLLKWLGEETFALYRISIDSFAYLGLLELGLGSALIPVFSQRYRSTDSSSSNHEKISYALYSGFRIYFFITLLSMAIAIPLSFALPYFSKVSESMIEPWQMGLLIFSIGLVSQFTNPLRSFVVIRQESYRLNLLTTVQQIAVLVLGLFLAWKGYGIRGQLFAFATGQILFAVALLFWERSYIQSALNVFFQRTKHAKELSSVRKEIWQQNRPAFLIQLGGRLSLLSDNLIISFVLSPISVPAFFLTQRMATLIGEQLANLSNSSSAGLYDILQTEGFEHFERRFLEVHRALGFAVFTFLTPLAVLNPYFIKLWVGTDMYSGDTVTLLACANTSILALSSLWGYCLSAKGHLKDIQAFTIAYMILNVGLSFFFTYKLGVVGPLLGTFIAYVLVTLWSLPYLIQKFIGVSISKTYLALLPSLFLSVTFYFVFNWLISFYTIDSWFDLILNAAIASTLFCTMGWFLILDAENRKLWKLRFAKILSRGKSAKKTP